jgi:hypothetical protein
MVKKILFAMLLLALMGIFAGCACPRADTNGTITKSFANCLQTGQDIVCNASPDVLAGANLLINVLKGVASAYIPGTAEFSALITAQNIQSVGCSTLTGLNGLIAYLQSTQGKTMMAKAGPMKTVSPQPFINWRDKT